MNGHAKLLAVLVLAGASLGGLAGCAQTEVPPEHYYRLAPARPAQSLGVPRLAGGLLVPRLLAEGLVGERPIAFGDSAAPGELRQYHYHFWSDPPPRMLQEALVEYLRESAVADLVVTPEHRTETAWVLTGKLRRLEQWRGEGPHVTLSLEFGLRHAQAKSAVWVRDYEANHATADDSVAAAVRGLNEALAEIYARLAADLAGG